MHYIKLLFHLLIARLQEVSMCSTILHPNDETNATKEVNETKASGKISKKDTFQFPAYRISLSLQILKNYSCKSNPNHIL